MVSDYMNFFKRKRNIYFSIIVMLTIVTGLISISFSYYVDETSKTGLVKFNDIDNRVQSEALKNGVITVGPQETVSFNVYVISNNNFESKYELFYQTKDPRDLKVYMKDNIKPSIPSHSVYEHNIVIENYKPESVDITIGVASSYLNKKINLPGEKIEQE